MHVNSERMERLATQLRKRKFTTEIFKDGNSAVERIREVTTGKTVGLGSSMTLEALGLSDDLESLAKSMFLHRPGGAGESERNALTADVF